MTEIEVSEEQACCLVIGVSLLSFVLLYLFMIYFYSGFNWEMIG